MAEIKKIKLPDGVTYDILGEAQFIPVTTAEYNNLTPTQKNDPNIWYWISDMDGVTVSVSENS